LKPPGTMRLKLKYHEPLSNFAFKFNLHRYTKVAGQHRPRQGKYGYDAGRAGGKYDAAKVGAR